MAGVESKSEPRPAPAQTGDVVTSKTDNPGSGNASFDFEINTFNVMEDNIAREHLPTNWSSYDWSARAAKIATADFRKNSIASAGGPMVGVVIGVYTDTKVYFDETAEAIKSYAQGGLSKDSNPFPAIKVRVPGLDPWPVPQSESDLATLAMYPTYIGKEAMMATPKVGDLVYVSYKSIRARIGPTYEGPVLNNGTAVSVPMYGPGSGTALANTSPKLNVDCAIKEKAKAAGVPPEQGAKMIEESKQAEEAKAAGEKPKEAKTAEANEKKKKKSSGEYSEVEDWDEICSETIENPPGLEGFYPRANVNLEDVGFGSIVNLQSGLESSYKKLFRTKYNMGRLRRVALAASTYYRVPPECVWGVIYMECHWYPVGTSKFKKPDGSPKSTAYGMGQIMTSWWYRNMKAISKASGRVIHHGLLLDPGWGLWGCAAYYCANISKFLTRNKAYTKAGNINWERAFTTADRSVSDDEVREAILIWSGKSRGNQAAALWTGSDKSPATLKKMAHIKSYGHEVYWDSNAVTGTPSGWKKMGPVFESDLVPPWGGAVIDVSDTRQKYSFFPEGKYVTPPGAVDDTGATTQSGAVAGVEDRSPGAAMQSSESGEVQESQ